jgi:hypothetical protein
MEKTPILQSIITFPCAVTSKKKPCVLTLASISIFAKTATLDILEWEKNTKAN